MIKAIKHILATLICISIAIHCYGAKHALLVGINNYGQASGWRTIHGADDIALFKPMLQRDGFKVCSLTEKDATKANVVDGMNTLIKAVKPGDIVYLHFSCHGQPVEDINNDEEDGWDEALVLFGAYKRYGDHGYKGENHLTDDELSKLLTDLRTKLGKDGFIYVTIDACHAGTSSRGNKSVRGTNRGFCYSGDKVYSVNKHKGQPQYYRLASNASYSDIVILEACRAWENNREITIDTVHAPILTDMRIGESYGSLSYHIYKQISDTGIDKDSGWVDKVKKSMDADKTLAKQKMVIEYTTRCPITP